MVVKFAYPTLSPTHKKNLIFESGTDSVFYESGNFKPLIAIPSPRDIPEVKDAIVRYLQKFDKIWFKYWNQSDEPYKYIKRYFLKSWKKEYTHLIILPDDLVVNEVGVSRLVNKILSNQDRYKVLMGNCKIEYNSPYYAMTKNLPDLVRSYRLYDWYSEEDIGKDFVGMMKVAYCGTPFAILHKDVVKEASFDNDRKYNGDIVSGHSEDLVLSHDLDKLNIPIWVHVGAYFVHMKGLKGAEI